MDRKSLEDIYRRLDTLETRLVDTVTFRPKREICWMPLSATLVVSMGVEALTALFGLMRERAARRSGGSVSPQAAVS
jgi:Ca-activated chloride channel family protein